MQFIGMKRRAASSSVTPSMVRREFAASEAELIDEWVRHVSYGSGSWRRFKGQTGTNRSISLTTR
jgi:hypothetical protein